MFTRINSWRSSLNISKVCMLSIINFSTLLSRLMNIHRAFWVNWKWIHLEWESGENYISIARLIKETQMNHVLPSCCWQRRTILEILVMSRGGSNGYSLRNWWGSSHLDCSEGPDHIWLEVAEGELRVAPWICFSMQNNPRQRAPPQEILPSWQTRYTYCFFVNFPSCVGFFFFAVL